MHRYTATVNPLPDDKILPLSKLKAFAEDNFDVVQIAKSFSCRVENIVEKVFSKGFFLRVAKPVIVRERVNQASNSLKELSHHDVLVNIF